MRLLQGQDRNFRGLTLSSKNKGAYRPYLVVPVLSNQLLSCKKKCGDPTPLSARPHALGSPRGMAP